MTQLFRTNRHRRRRNARKDRSASTAVDSDGDGLPDDLEFAIGSFPGAVDTDHDGLDDFTEIALGLDPLDGVAGQFGVIGALRLNDDASDI